MDLTGDGKADLLTGSYPGPMYVFRGGEGGFGAREALQGADGQPITVGQASAPFAVDWDRDGDLDLLVGNIEGKVLFLPREGPADPPRFGAPQPISIGTREFAAPEGDSGPVAADWDGDGALDLIVGCGDGTVLLFPGRAGERGPPALAGGKLLVRGHGWGGPSPDGHGVRAKPCVVDWDRDGQLDLLVGDYFGGEPDQGNVWLYRRAPPAR